MKMLARDIEHQLKTGGHSHYAVYEKDLTRLWPLGEKDREKKIGAFAKEYGFRLRFYRKGLCAIFDEWPRQERRV